MLSAAAVVRGAALGYFIRLPSNNSSVNNSAIASAILPESSPRSTSLRAFVETVGGGSGGTSGVNGSNLSFGQSLSNTLLGAAVMPPSLPRCPPLPPLGGSSTLGASYTVSGSPSMVMEEELKSMLFPSSMHEKAAAGMTGEARNAGTTRGTGPSPFPSQPSR